MKAIVASLVVALLAACATGPGDSKEIAVHFQQSVRFPNATTLSISPATGTDRWPSRDEPRITALWRSLATEEMRWQWRTHL
jgi:hypothetical protein